MKAPSQDEHGQSGFFFDVAVVGAGIGGTVAALRAAERGRSVLLVDARRILGGTAFYSGGWIHLWGATSREAYLKTIPLADPDLAGAIFERYGDLVDWLLRTGAPGVYETR